ncbi:electron transport complex subunit RsxG [Aestuariirhabdus litorea]|uniref:Ion-translocating oxidoreductase complex subunit G n=1 Tax=Aestuariirhabdus litorea TaxID=2528527 RepID=A0A3P3VJN8_9GAMM|nr:electron transport complex subunit RsxG [Aestuariirhabdus litorea]RRJ82912.1 electron transport complex subunit RsxG [Aestuariirhabdus litorea]RWW93071.1 electron transport complex subunit RsxG [Endozoicomonadaceae bacterium GTF-13]
MIGGGLARRGVAKPSYTQRPAYFAGILGMLSVLSGTLLTFGYIGTADAIAQRLKEDLQRSLQQVLPPGYYDNPPSEYPVQVVLASGQTLTAYQARRGEKPAAVAFEVEQAGYAGPIRLVMGVSAGGEILGVRVLAHTETPGLGDKIEIARDDWILSFNGHSLASLSPNQWAVKKDGGEFDQFSGATITPRAVVRAVHRGLEWHRDHGQQLLASAEQDEPLAAAPFTNPQEAD